MSYKFEVTSSGGNIIIGDNGGKATNTMFIGDIAEIIVCDKMLTSEERLLAQNYLKKKFDLKQI